MGRPNCADINREKIRSGLSPPMRKVYDDIYARYMTPSGFKTLWNTMNHEKKTKLLAEVGLIEVV